jgi:hypothetical protein
MPAADVEGFGMEASITYIIVNAFIPHPRRQCNVYGGVEDEMLNSFTITSRLAIN